MSQLLSACELRDRLKENDRRATAMPYLLLLQRKVKYVLYETSAETTEESQSGVEERWVEYHTGGFLRGETKEDLIEALKDNGYEINNEILDSIICQKIGYYWSTENVFLTDKGFEDHKRINGHNLENHRTYGIYAFRNKEIESLFALIDENIKLSKKFDNLKDFCPCGGIIYADTENCKTPLCYSCFEEIREIK